MTEKARSGKDARPIGRPGTTDDVATLGGLLLVRKLYIEISCKIL